MATPLRLGAAEQTLIAQLGARGATAAAERLSLAGLPTRRVESYHYTDLKMLLKSVPDLALGGGEKTGRFRVAGASRIVLRNGVPDLATALPAGVIATTTDGSALTERDDVVVRLNTALAARTLRLEIGTSVAGVIHIDRQMTGAAAHVADSVHVFVADGVSATIIETLSGTDAAHLGNHGTQVTVGKGAVATHVLVDLSPGAATTLATAEYLIGADAQLRTVTIHAGAGLSRINLYARFAGEGGHLDATGLNLAGDGQHSDITLELTHALPNCSSKPLYKQIARGRSKAAFQGKIIVAHNAQKTDAKLMMQGLMLSDEAEILSKPELEIFADDVVCGHGSTVGALDEDWLFYLMSRGIPKVEAESMLVRGFLGEVLDPIADEGLHDALVAVVDDWLKGK